MLSKPNRLPSFEITTVMREGNRIYAHGITLIYRVGKHRFSFIVSAKVDKRAVVRNRMRRFMSESVRHELPDLTQGIDGVFIGSKLLAGKAHKDVSIYIHELLNKTIDS